MSRSPDVPDEANRAILNSRTWSQANSMSRFLILAGCLVVGFGGCATHADRVRDVRSRFFSGDLQRAQVLLDEYVANKRKERDVAKLDKAMIELASGRPDSAERLLREVRDRFDHLEQKALGESAASLLTDDNTVAYSGEDYEKVLVCVFLALSNLMAGGEDAFAYSLQVGDKQHQIIQSGTDEEGNNPKSNYKRVAAGAYIAAMINEESHTNYDKVERSIQQVVNWEPDFEFGSTDLERAKHGRHSQPGNGVLYVFALVGRGPYKEQVSADATSAALLIADRILSHNAKYTLPPTISSVKIPAVRREYCGITNVGLTIDGKAAGRTETITDIGRLAVQQYESVRDEVLARAVVRRVVKKSVVYAGKDAFLETENPFVNLAVDLGGVAWEATETADTRSWGLLPDKIQVCRIELPKGQHRVSLRPHDESAPMGPSETTTVEIEDGRNTYLLANFPDSHLVGRILTSGRHQSHRDNERQRDR